MRFTCARTGSARVRLVAGRVFTRRHDLRSRTVAARDVRCRTGRGVSVRLKPSRATARRLAGARSLRLTLRVAVEGSRTISRQLTIRAVKRSRAGAGGAVVASRAIPASRSLTGR